jgi:hypothetical protein
MSELVGTISAVAVGVTSIGVCSGVLRAAVGTGSAVPSAAGPTDEQLVNITNRKMEKEYRRSIKKPIP